MEFSLFQPKDLGITLQILSDDASINLPAPEEHVVVQENSTHLFVLDVSRFSGRLVIRRKNDSGGEEVGKVVSLKDYSNAEEETTESSSSSGAKIYNIQSSDAIFEDNGANCVPDGDDKPSEIVAARQTETEPELDCRNVSPTYKDELVPAHSEATIKEKNGEALSNVDPVNEPPRDQSLHRETVSSPLREPESRNVRPFVEAAARDEEVRTKEDDTERRLGSSTRSSKDVVSPANQGSVSTSRSLGGSMKSSRMKLPSMASMRWSLLSKAVAERRIETHRGSRTLLLDSSKKISCSAPTKLHELCQNPDIALRDLEKELEENPAAAAIKDARGRLPLHILGDNDDLVSSAQGRATASSFASQLIVAYPDAITTNDNDGFMPFVRLISDWHTWVYEKQTQSRGIKKAATNLFGIIGSIGENFASSPKDVTETETEAESEHYSSHDTSTLSSRSFPQVEMWEEVKWCFQMLSVAMDEMGGKTDVVTHKFRRRHGSNNGARTALVTHIAIKIPNIMKTLLLLDDEGGTYGRKRIFRSSLLRRMLCCPESVTGKWLTSMLRKKGTPSTRAIDFLAMVSDVNPKDYVGEFRSISSNDILLFKQARDRVFDAIESLDGTIASLVVLGEREVERASATSIVWHIMSKSLCRPFVVALLMIDFVLHLTLLFVSSLKYKRHSTIFAPFSRCRIGI